MARPDDDDIAGNAVNCLDFGESWSYRVSMPHTARGPLGLRLLSASAALSLAACSSGNPLAEAKDAGAPPAVTNHEAGPPPGVDSTGESIQSVEWVSFHIVIPFQASDFHNLASGLFGTAAQAGNFIDNQEVSPGVYLSSVADPSTPAQSRVSLTFDDGTSTHRTLALAPASFDVGSTYVQTIDAAIATMQQEEQESPGSSESYLLQYQVVSPKGGTFSFGVQGNLGVFSLVLDVASPTTSLNVKDIGQPATSTAPYDSIAGTVYFHMTKDDFDYFVQHAYGTAASVGQNFSDFELVPHTWLRLTVQPHLEQKYVDVGFKLAPLDGGTQIPIAQAPASVLAGATFQALVDRSMATMNSQEAATAGSSSPFQIPFYYDDPSGGGVVQVIVQGTAGVYVVDYAVQSPRHTLSEVPFNAYKPVTFNPPDASANAACNQMGNPAIVLADQGAFDITFSISSTLASDPGPLPLVGNIYCSTFNASDVTAAGPNQGAVALQNFVVNNASFQPGAPAPHYLTGNLPTGNYQILCGQDLHHDGNVEGGDPVTIPIGGVPLACNLNPITVQFALLDPQ